MKVLFEGKHQHYWGDVHQYGRDAIVVCKCGRLARAYHPGNPAWSAWRGVGPIRRWKIRKILKDQP